MTLPPISNLYGPEPTPGLFRIAAAALFVALGATDDEMDPAFAVLQYSAVPTTIGGVARQARGALDQVRIQRAGGEPRDA